jgi:CubicO group peptidase (beta-lactamase class C family)
MPWRLTALFAAVLIAAGCAGSRGGQPSAVDTSGITSVLVAKHGRVLRESYYDGVKATDRLPMFSVTKSVVSALVGIALAERRLRSVDERLVDFFPGADRRIRLRHLLSMTAGYGRQLNFGDTDGATLAERPLVNVPGVTFNYDSGSSDLLAAILTHVTHMSVAEYAQRRLFTPMRIRDVRWPGAHGGSGLLLRPRELLRFGQLYLDDGAWNGRQIVPAGWVRTSTRSHVRVAPQRGPIGGYGYDWWVDSGRTPFFAAHGYLGQVLVVFPRLDEVVVVTSQHEDFGGTLSLALRIARA